MTESLWLDEATTALVAKMPLTDIFNKFLPGDFHPPLYYLLMKFWIGVFGSSEVSLRTPSLIFALLTVYLVYKMYGKVWALLLATSPLLFYYAQEARMYSMAMFLVALAIFSFVKITKRSRVEWWVLFSISLFLIGATDYVALLILPVFWYLGRGFWKKLLASHIILVGFGVLWLPYFLKQFSSGLQVSAEAPAWSQLLGQTSFKNLILIPVKFMIGRVSLDDKWLYVLVVELVGLLLGYLVYRGREAPKIIWLWLLVPLALGVVISFWVPVLSYFRFLFVLPAFYVLVASGIKSKLFLWLVLGLNLLLITYYLLIPRFHREDWGAAAIAIGNDQVIFPADSQKEALIYYRKGGQIVTEPSGKRVWLSRYVWQVFDPTDSVRKKIESLGYNKVSEYSFNGVEFYLYAYRN